MLEQLGHLDRRRGLLEVDERELSRRLERVQADDARGERRVHRHVDEALLPGRLLGRGFRRLARRRHQLARERLLLDVDERDSVRRALRRLIGRAELDREPARAQAGALQSVVLAVAGRGRSLDHPDAEPAGLRLSYDLGSLQAGPRSAQRLAFLGSLQAGPRSAQRLAFVVTRSAASRTPLCSIHWSRAATMRSARSERGLRRRMALIALVLFVKEYTKRMSAIGARVTSPSVDAKSSFSAIVKVLSASSSFVHSPWVRRISPWCSERGHHGFNTFKCPWSHGTLALGSTHQVDGHSSRRGLDQKERAKGGERE